MKIMLPSRGYFSYIDCPYFVIERNCCRPYCHYKHPERNFSEDDVTHQVSTNHNDSVRINSYFPSLPDYDPFSQDDAELKTYSLYLYKKCHDAQEVVDNYKNLIVRKIIEPCETIPERIRHTYLQKTGLATKNPGLTKSNPSTSQVPLSTSTVPTKRKSQEHNAISGVKKKPFLETSSFDSGRTGSSHSSKSRDKSVDKNSPKESIKISNKENSTKRRSSKEISHKTLESKHRSHSKDSKPESASHEKPSSSKQESSGSSKHRNSRPASSKNSHTQEHGSKHKHHSSSSKSKNESSKSKDQRTSKDASKNSRSRSKSCSKEVKSSVKEESVVISDSSVGSEADVINLQDENSTNSNDEKPAAKVRIAHVPNVTSFLSAKERIKSVTSNLKGNSTNSKEIGNHEGPIVSTTANSFVPANVRQSAANNLYDELKKVISPEEAASISLQLESNILSEAQNCKTYKNLIAVATMKIRKKYLQKENS